MKKLSFSLFALFIIGMQMTSCKKEAQKDPQLAPTQSAPQLYERRLQVYDEERANTATLRFQASSKEALAGLNLDDLEFTLVKTPEDAKKPNDLSASSAPAGPSFANGAATRSTISPEGISDKAVSVDLLFDPSMPSATVEVKSKGTVNNTRTNGSPSVESLSAATSSYNYLYYHKSYWRRVQVTNKHYNPIYVWFYYHNYYNNSYYSGYSWNLYQNGYAYYYNCSNSVGAYVRYSGAFRYNVTWWSNCQ